MAGSGWRASTRIRTPIRPLPLPSGATGAHGSGRSIPATNPTELRQFPSPALAGEGRVGAADTNFLPRSRGRVGWTGSDLRGWVGVGRAGGWGWGVSFGGR